MALENVKKEKWSCRQTSKLYILRQVLTKIYIKLSINK